MTRAVICDVNETLLDLGALDPLFAGWFGEPGVRRDWFTLTLHIAMTCAATRTYRPFGEIGAAALAECANRRGAALPADASAQLREAIADLPAHPDVVPALSTLHDAGFLVSALSNNPLAVLREQMRRSGLDSYLVAVMSVEEAGALKPAPEVYHFAIKRLGLPPEETWMVAAHGWDIAGAQRAGLRGAFVARPGQYPDPLSPPAISGPDLTAVASRILSMSGAG